MSHNKNNNTTNNKNNSNKNENTNKNKDTQKETTSNPNTPSTLNTNNNQELNKKEPPEATSNSKSKIKTINMPPPDILMTLPFELPSFITNINSKKYIENILSYLPVKDYITFLISNKFLYKNYLIPYYTEIDKNIKEFNGIQTIENLNKKIEETKEKIDPDDEPTVFTISKSIENAILKLDKEINTQILKETQFNNKVKEVIIIYKLLIQLFDKKEEMKVIKSDRLFWKKLLKYFNTNYDNKLGTFLLQKAKAFDFSNNNLLKLQLILKDNTFIITQSGYFNKICGSTGLLVFLIKECLEYTGIIYNDFKTNLELYISFLEFIKNTISNLELIIDKYI